MHNKLQVPFSVKALENGIIEGYGSVFNVLDSYDDIVRKGAFSQSLKAQERMPAMLWQHDPSSPIGVWTDIREDDVGLYVKGQIAETQLGRESYSLMSMGAMSGLSIGYTPDAYTIDNKTGIRYLDAVTLWEVSPVTFPANNAARLTAIKSIREFERLLRDNGFSKSDAVAISLHGFKAKQGDPAAALQGLGDPVVDEILKALNERKFLR